LIGPNGAGKTTIFNLITGVYPPSSGDIILNVNGNNIRINNFKPYKVTQSGIARTFQNIRLFKELSIVDNVKIAMHFNVKYNPISAVLRTNSYFREEDNFAIKTLELLDIFQIKSKANELAKNLPYGEQRKLEIARALATSPRILLLDEPAAGMNPQETNDLMNLIATIKEKFDLTILLIEHDMNFVMGICQRIIVLDYGETIAMGTPGEISKDQKVIKAYLGEEI